MNTTIGARVKQIRLKLKMTQKEFAESLGVTQTTISGIEKDSANTSLTLIKLISLKYNVSESWIIEGIGEMEYFPTEWSISDIEGLLQKLEAMKILLNKKIDSLKVDKDKLYIVVESFSYFVSLMATSKLDEENSYNYLQTIFDVLDKLEKYVFQCSILDKKKTPDFERLYDLNILKSELQMSLFEATNTITNIFLENAYSVSI